MASRTTPDLVEEILASNYDARKAPSLLPFIRAASIIVDNIVTCAAEKGITLTAAELKELETWLAAHAYANTDRPYSEKGTGGIRGARGKFDGKTGLYLESTMYGQMAVTLDRSGCLSQLVSQEALGKVAVMFWGGLPPSEQTPYDERD